MVTFANGNSDFSKENKGGSDLVKSLFVLDIMDSDEIVQHEFEISLNFLIEIYRPRPMTIYVYDLVKRVVC